jgi:amino acid transporter
VAGALISIAGELCHAELCTAYLSAGGDYHFLQRAFGRNLSFMCGWSRTTIINSGSIALLAFVFGDCMSTLLNLGAYSSAIWRSGWKSKRMSTSLAQGFGIPSLHTGSAWMPSAGQSPEISEA